MSGKIVAEYENFSVWESGVSEPVPFFVAGTKYLIAQSWIVNVATYEEALLEPEWEIFV